MLRQSGSSYPISKYRAPVTLRTNAHDIRAALAVKANRLSDGLDDVARQIAEAFADVAREQFSTGHLTYTDLRRMGHPYSRRNPTSPDPWVINLHTGTFYSGWRVSQVRSTRSSATYQAINDAVATQNSGGTIPYYEIIGTGGTRLMMTRPIVEHTMDAVESQVDSFLKSFGNNIANLREIGRFRGRKNLWSRYRF